MPVTAGILAAGTAGTLLLWSAVTGKSVTMIMRDVIGGKGPGKVPVAEADAVSSGPVTSSGGGSQLSGTRAANRALGRVMAGAYGWGSGPEWTALDNIAMAESGWDANIVNPTSTASGIAQNINGFGPGYLKGNAPSQIAWFLSYIRSRYGDPVAAWQFHLANGWY
jgi:hypothetical protein